MLSGVLMMKGVATALHPGAPGFRYGTTHAFSSGCSGVWAGTPRSSIAQAKRLEQQHLLTHHLLHLRYQQLRHRLVLLLKGWAKPSNAGTSRRRPFS